MLEISPLLLVFLILLGATCGALAGWVLAGRRAGAVRAAGAAATEAALEEARSATREAEQRAIEAEARLRALQELQPQREQMAKQVEDSFGRLAGDALRKNSTTFLEQAKERFQPVQDALKDLREKTEHLEKNRASAYAGLKEHLEQLSGATERLRSHSEALAGALRGSSKVRGNLGEMVLRNVVELAGLSSYCDFVEQKAADETRRPDLVVKLPGGDALPIDAKFPLSAYQEAVAAEDAATEKAHLQAHARALRAHVRALAARDYADAVTGAIDFTVLFLPGDHLLEAALRVDATLQEDALQHRVLLTTPVTLVALLRTVGIYWQQQSIADDAQRIWDLAKEHHARVVIFQEHFARAGRGIGQAVRAFNDAAASYESRVLPTGRKLEEHVKPSTKKKLESLDPIEPTPRVLSEREAEAEAEAGGE